MNSRDQVFLPTQQHNKEPNIISIVMNNNSIPQEVEQLTTEALSNIVSRLLKSHLAYTHRLRKIMLTTKDKIRKRPSNEDKLAAKAAFSDWSTFWAIHGTIMHELRNLSDYDKMGRMEEMYNDSQDKDGDWYDLCLFSSKLNEIQVERAKSVGSETQVGFTFQFPVFTSYWLRDMCELRYYRDILQSLSQADIVKVRLKKKETVHILTMVMDSGGKDVGIVNQVKVNLVLEETSKERPKKWPSAKRGRPKDSINTVATYGKFWKRDGRTIWEPCYNDTTIKLFECDKCGRAMKIINDKDVRQGLVFKDGGPVVDEEKSTPSAALKLTPGYNRMRVHKRSCLSWDECNIERYIKFWGKPKKQPREKTADSHKGANKCTRSAAV